MKKKIFRQWGDSLFISIQIVIIIMQILWFSKYKISSLLFLILFSVISIGIYNHQIPFSILNTLQGSTIFIILVSKVLNLFQMFI